MTAAALQDAARAPLAQLRGCWDVGWTAPFAASGSGADISSKAFFALMRLWVYKYIFSESPQRGQRPGERRWVGSTGSLEEKGGSRLESRRGDVQLGKRASGFSKGSSKGAHSLSLSPSCLQTLSPQANPESWAWRWSPGTTSSPLRWSWRAWPPCSTSDALPEGSRAQPLQRQTLHPPQRCPSHLPKSAWHLRRGKAWLTSLDRTNARWEMHAARTWSRVGL